MEKKLKPFQTIKGRKNAVTSNPKLTSLQVELAQVQQEIETLIDTLTGANPVLLSYVNSKIEELVGANRNLSKTDFRWYTCQHMHMVRYQMSFQYLHTFITA